MHTHTCIQYFLWPFPVYQLVFKDGLGDCWSRSDYIRDFLPAVLKQWKANARVQFCDNTACGGGDGGGTVYDV